MAEGNRKKGRLPSQTSLYFRIVVGIYLFYLAYTIVENIGTSEGIDYFIFIAASVFFVIFGIVLSIQSVKALKKGEYLNGAADIPCPEQNGEDGEQNPAPRKRIRFDENDDIDV